MKLLKLFWLLCTALIVASCVSTQPQLPEVMLPAQRISQSGYSFVPLNEKGWVIVGRNANRLALAKRGENPDETFAVEAIPFGLPAFKTNEEFLNLVKPGQNKDTNSQRFNTLKHEVTADSTKATDCARSHMVAEDRGAVKRSEKSGNMIFEVLTLTCAHPKNKSIGISIGYSHRYYTGQNDPAFVEKGSSVLNSVEFTDF